MLGLTFKENCPDLRNSKVVDIVRELERTALRSTSMIRGLTLLEAQREYGIKPVRKLQQGRYDAVVIAVAHREFKEMGAAAMRRLCRRNHVLFDIKYVLPAKDVDGRL